MDDFLAAQTRLAPEAPALIFEGRTWTYRELNREVAGVCARLAAAGVGDGDRVGVLLPNVPAFVFIVHALVRMRAVIVPLNLRLKAHELADQVERSGASLVVLTAELAGSLPAGIRRLAIDGEGGASAGDAGGCEAGEVDLGADFGILFTSGTTGRPRGAAITLAAIQAAAGASTARLGTFPDDRWLLAMPLYHIGGLAILFRCCLNGTAVVLQEGFEPEAVWAALERERVTLLSVVPIMLRRLIAHAPDRRPPAALRLVLVGGAAASEALIRDAAAVGWPVALTYGLTEAVSQVATALPESVRRKPGSVGKPLPGTRVRIGAPGAGDFPAHDRPPGEPGEIYVSGPTLMRGYLGEPPAGGWLATGDIGCLDADGDLQILQRRTDLIVSGGENVYPAEVERVLLGHPGIRDVCVVGVEDAEWGARPAAAIVPADPALSAADVENFLRPRLAGFKLPRAYVFVNELPCTASGKVCRPDVLALFGS